MKEECSCWMSPVNENQENSSGFHILEIHTNSTGLSALYIFAIVGFAFLIYVIYIKCKGRYVFHQHQPEPTNFSLPTLPQLRYDPEPRIVEIHDEERRNNQQRARENWQNNI